MYDNNLNAKRNPKYNIDKIHIHEVVKYNKIG